MTETVLDVREIAPRDRHPHIFHTFDALKPGESFVLANDHDPLPLYYQFSHERAGRFEWTYLEQGPELWRVRIATRRVKAPRAAAPAGKRRGKAARRRPPSRPASR